MSAKRSGVVMLSGGIDSAALAVELKHKAAIALRGTYLNLGQYSNPRQRAAVKRLGLTWDFPVEVIEIPGLLPAFESVIEPPHILMTEGSRPVSEVRKPGTAANPPIFVPPPIPTCGDSCLSLTLCGVQASVTGADILYYPATKEDAVVIPGLEQMLRSIEKTVRINTRNAKFSIETPYIDMSHGDVLKRLVKRDPKAMTWSCYWGNLNHCGKCGGCLVRKARYRAARVSDQTIYNDVDR